MQTPGEFKWFGEGFEGFPKSLPDDCVEYCIFHVDNATEGIELRDQLRKVQVAATKLTKALTKDFIWQKEGFTLELVKENGRFQAGDFWYPRILLKDSRSLLSKGSDGLWRCDR